MTDKEAKRRALRELVERHPTEFERLVEKHRCALDAPLASEWLKQYDARRQELLEDE